MPSGWRSNFYESQKEVFLFGEDEFVVNYKFDKNNFVINIGDQNYEAQIHSIENGKISSSEYYNHFGEASSGGFSRSHSADKRRRNGNHNISVEINGIISHYQLTKKGNEIFVHNDKIGNLSLKEKERFPLKNLSDNANGYTTPMPSKVVKVEVEVGQAIKKDDPLVILNSMKMENVILANEDGVIEEIFVEAGENIEAGVLLLKMK